MEHIRYQKLLRMGKRGMDIIQAPDQHPAIEVVAPILSSAFLEFVQSTEELRITLDQCRAQTRESNQMVEHLRELYNIVRFAVMASGTTESVRLAGQHYPVPEDLFHASRNLISLLDNLAPAPWAQKISTNLTETLLSAQESWGKRMSTKSQLQKLQAQNRDNADKLQHALVHVRLVLRSVYGRSSREYQMLRASKMQQGEDSPQSTPDTAQPTTLTQIATKNAA